MDPRLEDRMERDGGTLVRWGCLVLLGAGMVHAIVILVTGSYEFVEYGIHARLEGWDARIAAGLELALFTLLSVWFYRSKDSDDDLFSSDRQ